MAKIDIEIADLESVLLNFPEDHTEEEIHEMEEDLSRYRHVKGLWEGFEAVPADPDTGRLETEFVPESRDGVPLCRFPSGTSREEVWYWFEEAFGLSVAEDLMY